MSVSALRSEIALSLLFIVTILASGAHAARLFDEAVAKAPVRNDKAELTGQPPTASGVSLERPAANYKNSKDVSQRCEAADLPQNACKFHWRAAFEQSLMFMTV